MNKRKRVHAITSILLVFFLFVPIAIQALYHNNNSNIKKLSFSKTSGTPIKTDAQFPYEEKEMEEEEKSTDHSLSHLLLICTFTPSTSFSSAENQNHVCAQTSSFCGSVPLYLAKRSILI